MRALQQFLPQSDYLRRDGFEKNSALFGGSSAESRKSRVRSIQCSNNIEELGLMKIWFQWSSLAGIEGGEDLMTRRERASPDQAFSVQ